MRCAGRSATSRSRGSSRRASSVPSAAATSCTDSPPRSYSFGTASSPSPDSRPPSLLLEDSAQLVRRSRETEWAYVRGTQSSGSEPDERKDESAVRRAPEEERHEGQQYWQREGPPPGC